MKHALVSVLGAEMLSAIAPVKPPDGVTVTVEVPLLPGETVTLVADSVKDSLLLEDEETVMVSVPEDAELTEEFEGV